jgi:hypothetical protein
MLFRLAGPAAALFLLASCKQKDELFVADSEGRRFAVRCSSEERTCALTQTAGPKAEATRPTLEARGRIVGVCDRSGDAPPHPADCRPLVCASDAECPPIHGPGSGSCLERYCVDPARAVESGDSVMLCLAGQGLGHEKREQVERYALGLNCGSPCVVPAPCQKR